MKERQILDQRYVLLRELGIGPTGLLFEGENLILGKRVAIKMINPALARRPGVAERVLEKAREAALLDHPNIASLLDLGEADGTPYIVTEQLGGHSLEREIDASHSGSIAASCDLILQVLAALDYAHAQGIVHGGLHPNNVLIAYPRPGVPWVKVTDFGLVQALEDVHGDGPHPAPIGGYRAPEYAASGEVTAAGDVYSAAALLHALLHGIPPGAEVEPSSRVPRELTAILAAALRRDPRDRTESAQRLAGGLAPFAQHTAARSADVRLSSPPSIRWLESRMSAPPKSAERPSGAPDLELERSGGAPRPNVEVSESLLRNPRFPSTSSPWARRWRALRAGLASHPSLGAAWVFALASVGAGIACALLAAWLE